MHNSIMDSTFYKLEAIKKMLDAYPIVLECDYKKTNYDGSYSYFMLNNYKFVNVRNNIVEDFNVNDMSYMQKYQCFRLTDNLIPQELWKSNLQTCSLFRIKFSNIITQYYAEKRFYTNNKDLIVFAMYVDDDNNQYTVKLEMRFSFIIPIKRNRTKDDSDDTSLLYIDTKGVTFSKKEFLENLRNWIADQLPIAERTLKKKKIKSKLYYQIQSLIDTFPEVII